MSATAPRSACRHPHVTLWWAVLVAGVVVYVGAAVGQTRANRGRRIRWRWRWRLEDAPWWSSAAMFVGPLLMIVGVGRVTSTEGDSYALMFGAIAVGIVGHAAVVWIHNLRSVPMSDRW